jgi:hypothetical protein
MITSAAVQPQGLAATVDLVALGTLVLVVATSCGVL